MSIRGWLLGLAALLVATACAGESFGQRPGGKGGPGGRGGGRPSFDVLLSAFDMNDDGALGESEVPQRVWARLSQADSNGDGNVTRKEFDSYIP